MHCLSPKDSTPRSITLHIIDVFADALQEVREKLPPEVMAQICEPMFEVAATADNESTRMRVETMFLDRVVELEGVSEKTMTQVVAKVLGGRKVHSENRALLQRFLKLLRGDKRLDASEVQLDVPLEDCDYTRPLQPMFDKIDAIVTDVEGRKVTRSTLRDQRAGSRSPSIVLNNARVNTNGTNGHSSSPSVLKRKRLQDDESDAEPTVEGGVTDRQPKKKRRSRSPSTSPNSFVVTDLGKEQHDPNDVRWTPTPFVEYDVRDLPSEHVPNCYKRRGDCQVTPSKSAPAKRNLSSSKKSPLRSGLRTPTHVNCTPKHGASRSTPRTAKSVRWRPDNEIRVFDPKSKIQRS